MKKLWWISIMFVLTACGAGQVQEAAPMMGGGDSGMMARHHAQVPQEYSGKTAPETTEDSILRGAEIYKTNCLSCHGESGAGDGPAGAALTPAPSPIGHTTQMLSDGMVFYRVSEGGAEFQTSMPAWKDILSEEQIWDVIAYVREIGRGNSAQIEEMQAAQQEAMLKEALAKGAVNESQAETFRIVHTALENQVKSGVLEGTMDERENATLAALVEAGTISQAQVDEFKVVHAILATGGFMP